MFFNKKSNAVLLTEMFVKILQNQGINDINIIKADSDVEAYYIKFSTYKIKSCYFTIISNRLSIIDLNYDDVLCIESVEEFMEKDDLQELCNYINFYNYAKCIFYTKDRIAYIGLKSIILLKETNSLPLSSELEFFINSSIQRIEASIAPINKALNNCKDKYDNSYYYDNDYFEQEYDGCLI